MTIRKITRIYPFLFSEKKRKKVEELVFIIAIIAFLFHLVLIGLVKYGLIPNYGDNDIALLNPLTAIYTPFSVILLYEIYSLIYYLPKSITFYLGKQYEIIILILIRKIFHDLADLSTGNEVFTTAQIGNLLIAFACLIIFCLLIFCFYKLTGNRSFRGDEELCTDDSRKKYVVAKKILALLLMVFFVILFAKSLFFLQDATFSIHDIVYLIKSMNETFFNTFFTVLILTEVMLLLLSFNQTEEFHKIIRNSGFIISTILLKLSFQTDGLMNMLLTFGAIAFGVAILGVYRLFERKLDKKP
ncbi:MAG: hypothetical protein PARBA_01747 [Parabacteroides sp.]